MRNAIIDEILTRFEVDQALLAETLELSEGLISLYANGKKPIPNRILWALGVGRIGDALLAKKSALTAEHVTSKDLSNSPPPCPQCGAAPRLRPDYLEHWFHGDLNSYAYCNGTEDRPHKKVKLGILAGGSAWIRLDRVLSKAAGHTNREVPLLRKRSKTPYEVEHGWVWCPACGWMCRPGGNYTYHARGSSTGPTYKIFVCTNLKCPQRGQRLKCKGGKILRRLPHRGRMTTLPKRARKCQHPHCGGDTIRNGRGPIEGLLQLRCKRCRKVLHFNPAVGHGGDFVTLKPGPRMSVDPHRPRACAKHGEMHSWRVELRTYRKRRQHFPSDVRRKVDESIKPATRPRDDVLVVYFCKSTPSHITVWKLPDGKRLATAYKSRDGRRRRGAASSRSTASLVEESAASAAPSKEETKNLL